MNNTVIRQQLHNYIDTTEDIKVEALYTLLKKDFENKYVYTEDDLKMLHERAEKYEKGESKTYTVEESHNKIRQQ